MPLSQKMFGSFGSYKMREGRFTIASEPQPCPSCVHLAPPSAVCQSPRLATPAMILSWPGTTESRQRFPHSDGIPARLPVTFTHSARSGRATKVVAAKKRRRTWTFADMEWMLGGIDGAVNSQPRIEHAALKS